MFLTKSLASRARGLVLSLIALVLLGVGATPASAHAIVERTEPGIDRVVPTSPERVVMYFSEPVELSFGAIHVFNTDGERVDEGEADHLDGQLDAITVGLRPDLPEGTYTVSWRVISADSHPISEAFVFHVGSKGASSAFVEQDGGGSRLASPLLGFARWLDLAGLLVLLGGIIFLIYAWPGTERDPGTSHEVTEAFSSRWVRIMRLGWWAAVLGTVTSLPLQAAVAGEMSMTDAVGAGAMADVLDTRFGKLAAVRLAILILGAVVYLVARVRKRTPELAQGRSVGAAGMPVVLTAPMWVMGLLALLAIATPGLAGHAGTTSPVAINVVADVIHVVAVSAWIGGLVFLAFAAFPATLVVERQRVAVLGPVIHRFSNAAVVSVGAVVLSGTFASYMQVRSWQALFDSTYGLVLVAKIAVFIPLVALGGVNKNVLIPRIDRAVASGDDDGGVRSLKRVVSFEVILSVVVLTLTAWLITLAPARTAAPSAEGPFQQTIALGEGRLDVLVTPNRVGENEVHLTAVTSAGAPLKVKQMRALFTMSEQEIGPIVGKGRLLAPGHFVVQGHQLSVPGTWDIEVVARTSRFDEERATFELNVQR
jgi:copper transport protein